MPYYNEAAFRTALGSATVDGYFETSEALADALEEAQDRVWAAVHAAGYTEKSPDSFATPAAAPAVLRRACKVAMMEAAAMRRGVIITDLVSADQLLVFDQIRDGQIRLADETVDDTTGAVGGIDYTGKGVALTSSTLYVKPIFNRDGWGGAR